MPNRRYLVAAIFAAILAAPLGGCGSSTSPPIPQSARLEPVPGSAAGKIVLSSLGAQRIGLTTAKTRGIPAPRPTVTTGVTKSGRRRRIVVPPRPGGPTVMIPYSSVIYDPSGRTYAFVMIAQLTYAEVPITVDRVTGNVAYLLKGPRAGAPVVSTGAEELYGVQTGVLAQT